MIEKEDTRLNKIKESCLDTATDATIDWLEKIINENLPKVYDRLVEKVQKTVTSFFNSNKKSTQESIKDVIYEGIEIGEHNKERSMIIAMKDSGMSNDDINKIISSSKKYLITREKLENESK